MSKKTRASSLENIFVSETHRVIYNEISYLKRRLHLVEGERKANYESNEETLKKNELLVKDCKEKNAGLKAAKKQSLQSKEIFLKEISSRLGGEKKAYEFKDKKFLDVVDILECKIGTYRNKQNYLKYNKAKQAVLMREVVEKEEQLQKMIEGKKVSNRKNKPIPPAVQKRLDGIKSTETSIAAMMMKINEADNIRSRYKDMICLLKRENFTLTTRVGESGHMLDSERVEIDRIRTVLQDSLKAKKVSKIRLTEIEETTIKDYSSREQNLHEARQKLKTIREKMEQIGSKLSFPKFHMIHRDSSATDGGLYPGGPGGSGYLDDKRGEGGKITTIVESVYTELATMIGESDPALIVTRFLQQRTHAGELGTQEDAAKSAVRKAKLRKRFLVDKLSQLQYSGGLKREKLNARTTLINEAMSTTSQSREKLDQWLQAHSQLMDEMLGKLKEICANNDFKIPGATLSSEVPAENVASMLKLVLKQLERLLGSGFDGGSSFSYSPMPPTSQMICKIPEDDHQLQAQGGLIPFEITTEGPSIFNLPSPAGSATSFRLGGSLSDIEYQHNPMSASGSDIFTSGFRDRAPSIIVHGHDGGSGLIGMQQLLEVTELTTSQMRRGGGGGSADVKSGRGSGRRDSSEEEEAVTRNFVKRQSQILFEAKTRTMKGRFGQGGGGGTASPAGGGGGKKY